jgi:hypothetical protein
MHICRPYSWIPRALVALVLSVVIPLTAAGSAAPVAAQESYTVMDVVIWSYPQAPPLDTQGHCISLAGGTLHVSLRALEPGVGPVEFTLAGYRGLDGGNMIQTVVTPNEHNQSFAITGGLYCYTVANRVFRDANFPLADIRDQGQGLHVKMSLAY